MAKDYFPQLSEIYQQCNENLRESDKKRDQLIAFYTAIVAIFFNAFNTLQDSQTKLVLGASLGVLGIVLGFILIVYRKWHILYTNSAIVLQNLMYRNEEPTVKNIEETWENMVVSHDRLKAEATTGRSFFPGIEQLTFIAFLIVAFLPFYVIGWWIFPLHVLYVIGFDDLAKKLLDKELVAGYKPSWILRIEKRG